MKNVTMFLVMVFALVMVACTPLQAKRVSDAATQIDRSVEVVCSTVELFTSFGVKTLDPKVCSAALAITGSKYYATTYLVAKCVEKHKPGSLEFTDCLGKVADWKSAAAVIVSKI